METGGITEYIDVAQVTLYAFWIFFAGLIFYLRREDRREGYPLEHLPGKVVDPGLIYVPAPKVFRMSGGKEYKAPRYDTDAERPLAAKPIGGYHGAPLEATGNGMRDGVGPAAYALRADVPDMTFDNIPKLAPLRLATEFAVVDEDPDPRGMTVIGADGRSGGTCVDIWVDRSEALVRYLEIEVEGGRGVLLPMPLARVSRKRIRVRSITGAQFAWVPAHANPHQVTRLEEDKISAYYAGGDLYAMPSRQEPLL